ncbi:transketolase, C-terminal subunit [Kurthia zopfii]|uniref:1-deoxy-D-xylulose-5-phosphate synthase n=1 Tax=Kurthia zopfii TaxID=1650 RepID=A0A8B4Q8Q8_9BACL|nr:transketolase C-terminal domain-containing protein [Kurthia zopfii]PWI22643.1 transketolase [Kurthia zopfii]TDR39255.1 transketolase subunit B [Kurthia zopfii]GEK31429.1 transketolase, C-terminal subunit [Kurthia zopfii]STX08800.1 1-deoxy-D-xylulose-5-phosphate synthase [Kurthia zopfii]
MSSSKFSKEIKLFSRMGQRAVFGIEMLKYAEMNSDLMVLTADVSIPAGLDRFRKSYPNNYLDVGIAEQNMIGIAAGLSSEGFQVFTTTYAPFQTLRCLEQIRMDIGEMKNKVCMVGLSSGIVLGMIGTMHCSMEDISIIRSIPNITIVSPADSFELTKLLEASFNYPQSLYIRLTAGSPSPIVYREDYDFKIGKSNTLLNGTDVAIIGIGSILSECISAAKILEVQGISVEVINMHTINPLDNEKLNEIAREKKLLVTVEEHSIIGGLGGSIAEVFSSFKVRPPHLIMGLPHSYENSGIYEEMLKYYELDGESIARKIFDYLEE